MNPNTHPKKPFNPWTRNNLRLLDAACKLALLRHGERVESSFTFGKKSSRLDKNRKSQ